MTKDEYEGCLIHIQNFLESDPAQLLSQEAYEEILFDAMAFDIKQKNGDL